MFPEGTCPKILLLTALLGLSSALIGQNSPHYKQQTSYTSVIKGSHIDNGNIRKAALLPREIDDCIFVTSESGLFSYVSKSDDEKVCGVYLLTDPDRRVEIHFLRMDIPCESYALVSVVDGWELNGEVFPSGEDHPLSSEERVNEFCGNRAPKIFFSSQNAALIQYRIPKRGSGFAIFVRYPRNPMPCNVLAVSISDSFTLRNYGNKVNCTYTAIYPSIVHISGIRVGTELLGAARILDNGLVRKCNEKNPLDQVEIGGSYGLDTSKLKILDSICGVNSKSDYQTVVEYGVTSVRLISSGLFNNFVTVKFQPLIQGPLGFDFK